VSSWVVYSRAGCTLCEQFLVDLAAMLGERAAQVDIVDIDTDAELRGRYSDRIPVLTIDGDFVCGYRVDVERVRRYLEPSPPILRNT
jgi:hypothetical protein